jgi:FecR protein
MRFTLSATFALVSTMLAAAAFAAPAGTLLFTQSGAQILDANGVPRPAKRGDVIQEGERVRAPNGGISQLLLPDGSLIGMRPSSEIKLDKPALLTDSSKQLISLTQGAVRVIGSELMDTKKPSAFTFQSGLATLKLQGADLETALVKPDAPKTAGSGDAGSYNRLLIGTGSIGSGTAVEPLAPRQVSFVGAINVAPVLVSSVSPTLFSPVVAPISTSTLGTLSGARTTTLVEPAPVITSKLAPTFTTSTLTAPIVTAVAPIGTTTIAPTTTLIAPTKTYVAPVTTTYVAPTTSFIAPTTTYIAPIKTTYVAPTITYVPPPTKITFTSCKIVLGKTVCS